tara:strand:- start:855 stop:1331 length:477 start_codon:yes stop_codon:yes gene_type:complete
MLIYGIDPGFTGAISLYWTDTQNLEVHDMPVAKSPKGKTVINCHAVLDILQNEANEPCMACLEQVGAMRGQGVSSMFRFGEGYGQLQMGCAAANLPLHFVTPAKWKGHFGLNREKGLSRNLAMQRFPAKSNLFSRVKDDGRAESALICVYASEVLLTN